MKVIFSILGLGCLVLAFVCTNQPSQLEVNPSLSARSDFSKLSRLDRYGEIPLDFERNQGQTNAQVRFLTRSRDYTVFLTPKETVLVGSPARKFTRSTAHFEHPVSNLEAAQPALPNPMMSLHELGAPLLVDSRHDSLRDPGVLGGTAHPSVVRMKLVGANAHPSIRGLAPMEGKRNYFMGNDPAKWISHVSTFARVEYEAVYPGIDMVYYGTQKQLEYDFLIAPGIDPKQVQFDLRGARSISVDETGDLVLQLDDSQIRWHKPLAYQQTGQTKKEIAARYVLSGSHQVRFEVGDYDSAKPLVIDPVLAYSTYLGGSDYDQGQAIAIDDDGNAYLTGVTSSLDFPTEAALQSHNNAPSGSLTAFVTKINCTGSRLLYSTYLGGTGEAGEGLGIAVDSKGNAFVTGVASPDFPTTSGAFQTSSPGGNSAFVTKFDPSGGLVYSTYLGGSQGALGSSITVDSSGHAYVTGATQSTDFPTTPGAFQPSLRSLDFDTNAFVTKLNAKGSALIYSTYLGGSISEVGFGIALDRFGNAYVSGRTDSMDFPTTLGAFQTTSTSNTSASDRKGFVSKLNASGTGLLYSTYLGGSNYLVAPFNAVVGDVAYGIAVNPHGQAYVTGVASTLDFPTTSGAYLTVVAPGSQSAFVTKFSDDGSSLVYSTYLPDTANGSGPYIAIDHDGRAHVSAVSGLCATVSKLNRAGSALLEHICLQGTTASSNATGIAVDRRGDVYVTGSTGAADFPITPGVFQPLLLGNTNAFVTKLSLRKKSTRCDGDDCKKDDDPDDSDHPDDH
jgi:hypothetical protein